jgi:acetyltransferase-like isoleucine patch superfamily enzyme
MKPLLSKLIDGLAQRAAMRGTSVDVAASVRISWRGVKLRPQSRLRVGEDTILECTISSDREGAAFLIGERTFVGNSLLIAAERIQIGNDVLISWGCTIVDHDSHHLQWAQRRHDVDNHRVGRKNWDGIAIRPVVIDDKAWIGMNVIILKGVHIGEGAVVAAGSVVTRDVTPFTLVAGNPARAIRSLNSSLEGAHP